MILRDIHQVVRILTEEVERWDEPVVSVVAHKTRDPFCILIGCLLSLRTKDEVTHQATKRLFRVARTPEAILKLSPRRIERLIYPVGFYRVKARTIKGVAQDLMRRFHGRVPQTIEELLTFKGVGRKTANLVVTLGFGTLGICVDTHVHRISNRLGLVRTRTPHQTEFALRKILPKPYWIIYNDLLVSYGQHLCRPISPWCSRCRIAPYCARVGVTHSR